MLERLTIASALLVLVVLTAWIVRQRVRQGIARVSGQPLPAALREQLGTVGPAIVYFFGPACRSCRQQSAALESLVKSMAIPVVRIDASKQPALADALSIATVPATVIVDQALNVRAVNVGFRSRDVLAYQVRESSVHGALSESPSMAQNIHRPT